MAALVGPFRSAACAIAAATTPVLKLQDPLGEQQAKSNAQARQQSSPEQQSPLMRLWGGHADNSPSPSDSVPQSPMLRFIGGLAGPSAAAAGFLADPLGNMAGRERSCGSSQASEDGRGVPLRAGSGQSASGEPGGGGGGSTTGPTASQMQSRAGASAGLRRGGLPVRAGI